MVDRRAKETPSVTKPLTSNPDARTVHPKGGTASYEKGYDRVHPHAQEGYKNVGSKSKTGGDGKERVREGKVDYQKFDKSEKYPCTKGGCGYDNIKTGKDGDARKEGKKKSPWRQ